MESKKVQDQTLNLSDINKQILEIKKKIQLSEGQRKALFEDCEAEKKFNSEEIDKLKKENSDLILTLHENKSASAKLNIQKRQLEAVVGPLLDKNGNEIHELLDLQTIDKSKQLNLLQYTLKQKQKYLAELGNEYQILLSEKNKKVIISTVDNPVKKATCELQNKIQAVEIQLREADHIRGRYKGIKRTLLDDQARFESNIKKLEDALVSQRMDMEKLQQVMNEAMKMRSQARSFLLQEERVTMSSANIRERQAVEGKRLVSARKMELEDLERKVFESGKISVRPEPEGAEDGVNQAEDEPPATDMRPIDNLMKAFEILKTATGASTTEETLERFSTQKDTLDRLTALRKMAEIDKRKLGTKLEEKTAEVDTYKYAAVRDAERTSAEVEHVQRRTEDLKQKSKEYKEKMQKGEATIKSILDVLQKLYLSINPIAMPTKDALQLLYLIDKDLKGIYEKFKDREAEGPEKDFNVQETDDRWLPTPYKGLIGKTPLPQQSSPASQPPPPGSDDEEEVPSRGYLKRQAQLVVDAKSRRKNVRIQISKRN